MVFLSVKAAFAGEKDMLMSILARAKERMVHLIESNSRVGVGCFGLPRAR